MTEQLSKYQELLNKNKFNPETVVPKQDQKEEDLRRSYKLVNGPNEFRIIAWDDGSIIKINWVHMNLGVPFLCPNKLDKSEKCPDCEFGWRLYNENKKEHTDVSRNFLAQEKWTIRGIVRAEEKADVEKYGYPKIRFIDLSKTQGVLIESYFTPPQLKKWGNISDFFTGRDIELNKDEAKAKARQASVGIERSAVQSPVFVDVDPKDPKFEDMFVKMLENAIPNEERFETKTYKEILELMDNFRKKATAKEEKEETADFSTTSSGFSAASSSLAQEDSEDLNATAKRF